MTDHAVGLSTLTVSFPEVTQLLGSAPPVSLYSYVDDCFYLSVYIATVPSGEHVDGRAWSPIYIVSACPRRRILCRLFFAEIFTEELGSEPIRLGHIQGCRILAEYGISVRSLSVTSRFASVAAKAPGLISLWLRRPHASFVNSQAQMHYSSIFGTYLCSSAAG